MRGERREADRRGEEDRHDSQSPSRRASLRRCERGLGRPGFIPRFARIAGGDLGHEPVSAARQGLDEPRLSRRVSERLAQPAHGGVQVVVEVDEGLGVPEACAQLLTQDHLSGLLEEGDQDAERLVDEPDSGAVTEELAARDVDLEAIEAVVRVRARVDHGPAANLAPEVGL